VCGGGGGGGQETKDRGASGPDRQDGVTRCMAGCCCSKGQQQEARVGWKVHHTW